MQLGEASADEAFRIRYFPLSLIGPAFTRFTSLPAQSICSRKDLEQKFHAHYFIGSNEKKIIDLTTVRQRNNETPMEFLKRFRETKSMCFVNAKFAPSAKHTASRTSWLHTCRDHKTCQSIFLEN
jgi:hypothetical protein